MNTRANHTQNNSSVGIAFPTVLDHAMLSQVSGGDVHVFWIVSNPLNVSNPTV